MPLLLITLFLLTALFAASSAYADRFLLATFNNGEQALRILNSTNAATFRGYDQGVVYTAPPGNKLRDPSIIYHQGRYYACHTTGTFGAADHFSIITSDDLRNWMHLADVSMTGITGIQRTWAPEWFCDSDGSLHIFVSATTDTNDQSNHHVIYVLNSLDANDLSQWSAPEAVTGTAFGWTGQEDRRVGAYDAYVIKRSYYYCMFYFNASTDYIELASAPALTGPYTRVGTNNWQGIGLYKEGPSVIYLGGGHWRMFFADQIESLISYTDSTNNWQNWTPAQRVSLPGCPTNFTVNHGTVIMPPGGLEAHASITAQGEGLFNLSFKATEGDHYRLSTSTNLAQWSPDTIFGPTTNGTASLQIDTGSAARQFWKIERLLPD